MGVTARLRNGVGCPLAKRGVSRMERVFSRKQRRRATRVTRARDHTLAMAHPLRPVLSEITRGMPRNDCAVRSRTRDPLVERRGVATSPEICTYTREDTRDTYYRENFVN